MQAVFFGVGSLAAAWTYMSIYCVILCANEYELTFHHSRLTKK